MPVPPEHQPPANLRCPACDGRLFPRELECVDCGLHLQASYPRNEFARLDDDALHLLRIFVACEGRIRDMERALGVSYPTVKSRLAGLRETLGFGGENARQQNARQQKPRQKEARQKEARQKEARQKEARQKEARQKEARQKEARQKEARQHKEEPTPKEAPKPQASDTIGRLERGEIDFDEAMRRLQR